MNCNNNTDCNKCTFVGAKSAKENRKGIFDIVREINNKLKKLGYPGATTSLVGSSKRNMIFIKSKNSNQYDHDLQNIYFSTKKPIKEKGDSLRIDFINAFKDVVKGDGYKWNISNSTRVITTTKSKDNVLVASFDIALIDGVENKISVYNKKDDTDNYIWNELKDVKQAYIDAKNIDKNTLKQEYLNLKHLYKDISKKDERHKSSASLFIEAVNNTK